MLAEPRISPLPYRDAGNGCPAVEFLLHGRRFLAPWTSSPTRVLAMDRRPPRESVPLVRRVTCPWCCRRFRPEEAFWIVGPRATGHPGAGEADDGELFRPERFHVDGSAVTPDGGRTNRLACPLCRRGVPRAFFEYRPFFVSVVGEAGVGKASLMAAAVWALGAVGTGRVVTDAVSVRRSGDPLLEHDTSGERTDVTHGPHAEQPTVRRWEGAEPWMPAAYVVEPAGLPAGETRRMATRVISMHECDGDELVAKSMRECPEPVVHLRIADLVIVCVDPSHDGLLGNGVCDASRTARRNLMLEATAEASGRRSGTTALGTLVVVATNADRWLHGVTEAATVGAAATSTAWIEAWHAHHTTPRGVARVSKGLRDLLVSGAPEFVGIAERCFPQVIYVPTSSEHWRDRCDDRVPTRNTGWCEVPLVLGLASLSESGPRRARSDESIRRVPFPPNEPTAKESVTRRVPSRGDSLLATHRLLAMARSPMRLRVPVLRRMVDAAPACELLRSDLVDYERVLQQELLRELLALSEAGAAADQERARAIVAELADAEWQEPVGGHEIERLLGMLAGIQAARHRPAAPAVSSEVASSGHCFAGAVGGLIAGIALAIVFWAMPKLADREPPGVTRLQATGQPYGSEARARASMVDVSLSSSVARAIEEYEKAAASPERPNPRLGPLRAHAESELAAVAEHLRTLDEGLGSGGPRAEGTAHREAARAISDVRSRHEEASARFDRAVSRRRDADDVAITSMLDVAAASSGQEGMDALIAARDVLLAVEAESGVRRDVLRRRAQLLEEAFDAEFKGRLVSEQLDQSLAEGIEPFLAALDRGHAVLVDMQPDGEEAIAAVRSTAGRYRSAVAWSDVARCWRPLESCTVREAEAWRVALHRARSMPVRAHGDDDARWSILEDHLSHGMDGVPREFEALLEYLDLPVMKSDVHQTLVDERVFYCSDASGRSVFVDERTVKSFRDGSALPRTAGPLVPAAHLAVTRDLRELFANVVRGDGFLDGAIVSALRVLGDGDRVRRVDPILLCRLDGDVLRLAARRPLFRSAATEMLEIVERLRIRLGEQPRWVRSIHWTDSEAWRNARRNAEEVMPSGRALLRLADACEKSMREVASRPLFLHAVETIGWMGAEQRGLGVRLAVSCTQEHTGRLFVVRRRDPTTWRFVGVGTLERGRSVRLLGDAPSFGEPLFLDMDTDDEETAVP